MPVQSVVSDKSEVVSADKSGLVGNLSPDALPSLSTNGATPQSASSGGSGNLPKQSLFHRVRWFVLLVFVLLIIAAVFYFLNSTKFTGKVPTTTSNKAAAFVAPINVLDVEFTSDLQRDRFLKNFQDAGTATDLNVRYTLLLDNFSQLEAIYSTNHDPKTRKLLLDFSSYLIQNFPDNSKKDNLALNVPCYDSSCGVASNPAAVQAIIDKVKASTLGDDVKKAVLAKFDEAAYSKDPSSQWTHYSNAFNVVKSQYDLKKDASVKTAAQSLLDFMKAGYPERYASYERLFPDAFNMEGI